MSNYVHNHLTVVKGSAEEVLKFISEQRPDVLREQTESKQGVPSVYFDTRWVPLSLEQVQALLEKFPEYEIIYHFSEEMGNCSSGEFHFVNGKVVKATAFPNWRLEASGLPTTGLKQIFEPGPEAKLFDSYRQVELAVHDKDMEINKNGKTYTEKAEPQVMSDSSQAPEAKHYEQCGYKDYHLPGECGGEMRGFDHAYGYGSLVDLCDRHYEIAPDPRLIAVGLSSENMLLLCKAWKEKNYPVLADFAKHTSDEFIIMDENGNTVEPSGTVEFPQAERFEQSQKAAESRTVAF